MAVGNCPVSRALCTRLSRWAALVVKVVVSTSKVAAVRLSPEMVAVPLTSPVRPTAVVEPIDESSSWIRKPAKVPDALS